MLLVRFGLFLLGVLIVYLVVSLMAGRPLLVSSKGSPRTGRRRQELRMPTLSGKKAGSAEKGPAKPKTCPVCGEILAPRERIKSVVFQGGVRSGPVLEKMCRIYGCPHCFPANSLHPRICPVCGAVVPVDGHLEARMFERADRPRKHVHVLGCTLCRKPHFS